MSTGSARGTFPTHDVPPVCLYVQHGDPGSCSRLHGQGGSEAAGGPDCQRSYAGIREQQQAAAQQRYLEFGHHYLNGTKLL